MSLAYYKPVWIARSDGEREIKTKKHGRESNGPTDVQLNKEASEDDYFELLPVYHEVAQEWKRILGGMLHREQKGQADQKWTLVDFPENYRLYKNVRKDRGKTDAYFLYGYPVGRKKRYKSALDFFPHLLWLAEGKSDDRTDCSCKHCAPEWIQEVKPLPGRDGFAPMRKEAPPIKKENVATRPQSFATNPQVVVKQQQRSSSQDNKPSSKVAAKVVIPPPVPKAGLPASNSSAPRAPAAPVLTPNPLPSPKSREQDQDAHYNRYIYRPGELTWFNRGTAWGLSVITKRELFKDQRNQDRPRYLVQPLSHPFAHPATKVISAETDLRPWLAWSAPGPTHQALAAANSHYNTVDWKAVIEGRYGVGDAEVDGSILAAKMIDDSFALIEPLSNNTTTTGERTYNGMFLGGEKLWVGEPVRLRPGNGQDILIIHQIIEKLKPNSTNVASATIHVVGDVYHYTSQPYTPNQEPPVNPNLPIRLRQDLDYRNRVTFAKVSARTISHWKLNQVAARLGIEQIKGRWYESSILLPILHAHFQQDLSQGIITDVGTWINGRGDANSAAGKAGTRYKDRLETFGKAVPQGTKISRGLDGPVEENIFPGANSNVPATMMAGLAVSETGQGQGQAQAQGQTQQVQVQVQVQAQAQQVQPASDGDIAEFIDLDPMEDGFTQNYIEQGGQF
ncbi:hypothetical protein N7G274_007304 [Stereocaulon virgatum]|uniref:Cryptic loci regulator 2 N-terminal domain-containing protein n=1 Tax=Stereocaulon virgatum TaxID=373712 RepID=A0ABR4A4L8_9LECA